VIVSWSIGSTIIVPLYYMIGIYIEHLWKLIIIEIEGR